MRVVTSEGGASRPAGSLHATILRLALALVLAVGIVAVAPHAAAADELVVETTHAVAGTPEPDRRAVSLDLSLFLTDPAVPRPAIVLAHGFGGSKYSSVDTARRLARSGYAVITYTARGFGRSGGLIHLDDPAYEGADAQRIVDFAASRPEVLRTGRDPVLGFAGGSYGGAAALLAAGLDARVDAAVPAFTWHRLTSALFPQHAVISPPRTLAQVDSTGETGVFKQRWAALFFRAGGTGGGNGDGRPSAALCGRFAPGLCQAYLRTAQTGRATPELLRQLDRAGGVSVLDRITAPTLIIHGEQDTLFPLDQADANLRGLPAGTPAKMVWVAGGHDAGTDLNGLLPELQTWFSRYLKQDSSPPDTTFEAVVPQPALVGEGNGEEEPRGLTVPDYPGRGVELGTTPVRLDGPAQTVVSPPGGSPSALTSLPGTGGLLGTVSTVGAYPLAVLPGQAATFTSAALPEPYSLLGSGSVTLEVVSSTTTATLFVGLWDLGPQVAAPAAGPPDGRAPSSRAGTAVLPQSAIAPVALTDLIPGRAVSVRVALPAVAHEAPVGHRWQLVVSSTDAAYAVPPGAAVYRVALAGSGALTLPRVEGVQSGTTRLRVPGPLIAGVAALAVAATGLTVAVWLRRRSRDTRAELAHLPLVVDGLIKEYRGGVRAVDGVSFRVEPGQVVGLLGPNGAGKTTLMRMLVGLIHPDAGTVHIAGERVFGGADVLGSVGALIEGPGFLPHLSGLDNLRSYWAATGRPLAEAHLDEALTVAGLGSAVHRRVRGYSQGMRQRLGIAQAMLGRPALLLLDEPTNGLDPPQITAMRGALRDYAASGRTVVVSSHLLAEVQQTCTHAVVVHQGRVVLAGSMAELTASEDVTAIEFTAGTDLGRAQAALQQIGVTATRSGEGLRVTGGVPRARLVQHLVASGFGVDSVDGRRQLEEVFLALVGSGGGSGGSDA